MYNCIPINVNIEEDIFLKQFKKNYLTEAQKKIMCLYNIYPEKIILKPKEVYIVRLKNNVLIIKYFNTLIVFFSFNFMKIKEAPISKMKISLNFSIIHFVAQKETYHYHPGSPATRQRVYH